MTPTNVRCETKLQMFVKQCLHGYRGFTFGSLSQSLSQIIFILVGTKWCGMGNTARNYNDLGPHRATDRCCRAHDHCPISIPPLGRRYNLFNLSPMTISSCTCDSDFRKCLQRTGTNAGRQVLATYFYGLRPKCLVSRKAAVKECTLRIWFACLKHRSTFRTVWAFKNQ